MAATSTSGGLAVVRAGTSLDTFQDVLAGLAARYKTDEVLTAIKHLPARAAEFRAMPEWVRSELLEAYRAKGIEQLFSHQAAAAEMAEAVAKPARLVVPGSAPFDDPVAGMA